MFSLGLNLNYNQIDEIALHHDWNYHLADEGIGKRHKADEKFSMNFMQLKLKGWEKIDITIVK
jgi:Phospholipase A2-like domain